MDRELEEKHLHLPIKMLTAGRAPIEIEVQVKLDGDGVVMDAYSEGMNIASTSKTYSEMGVEVNGIRKATPEALTESVLEDMSIEFLEDGE